ncbi:MAG: 50S ribosomal protein L16, partial [Microgenomates group bacterium GW2011_GWC2_46_7]
TAVVKRGTIVFELGSIDEATAREAFRKAASKLPVLSRFVVRGAI